MKRCMRHLARHASVHVRESDACSTQVEDKTPFAKKYTIDVKPLPSTESTAEMYRAASSVLRGAGYEHYEVSNYARPGHRCFHIASLLPPTNACDMSISVKLETQGCHSRCTLLCGLHVQEIPFLKAVPC